MKKNFTLFSVAFLSLFVFSGLSFATPTSTVTKQTQHQNNQPASPEKSVNSSDKEVVVFNSKTKKYHKPNCKHTSNGRCKNCSKMSASDANKKGGKPCASCHKKERAGKGNAVQNKK